jgi:hypothetical protein
VRSGPMELRSRRMRPRPADERSLSERMIRRGASAGRALRRRPL